MDLNENLHHLKAVFNKFAPEKYKISNKEILFEEIERMLVIPSRKKANESRSIIEKKRVQIFNKSILDSKKNLLMSLWYIKQKKPRDINGLAYILDSTKLRVGKYLYKISGGTFLVNSLLKFLVVVYELKGKRYTNKLIKSYYKSKPHDFNKLLNAFVAKVNIPKPIVEELIGLANGYRKGVPKLEAMESDFYRQATLLLYILNNLDEIFPSEAMSEEQKEIFYIKSLVNMRAFGNKDYEAINEKNSKDYAKDLICGIKNAQEYAFKNA